ncbi:hypothetical protein Lal_00043555 [Lupinus albus]|nr:hypothetical protein Lal_00043667 [Lupinus albus]KAF1883314.1 hypothetical protein Lal_00038432 [Lupinus albus]KAF1883317.1 hypothetical protein Lal_00043555 [Lupinus albus]
MKNGTKDRLRKRFIRVNEASISGQNFTCFECRKPRCIKVDCSYIVKENPFKGKAEKKTRRAYIAWEDNDDCSNSKL